MFSYYPSRSRKPLWFTLAAVGFATRAQAAGRTTCSIDDDCRKGSECRPQGFCSNPFESGCLYTLLPEWKKKRVCNSQDPPEAIEQGICRVPDLDYMEVRIFSHNWESVFFESWILQILLSELLDVPTSMETGTAEHKINLYDSQDSFDYGSTNDWYSLRKAADLGDCRLASKDPDTYESCAHVVPEVWNANNAWIMAEEEIAEAPQALGVLGQEGWFVPKFTARQDPNLLSYLGLQGEEKRRKLADLFLRPTTWKDYCEQVSPTRCLAPDQVVARGPQDEWENDRMFVQDLYTGHFRKTEENDCDKFPLNCTGHIADYPNGWSSHVLQQAHHLNIPVKSSGSEPGSDGYSYSQLTEIWAAANATKSNVIMYWWYPNMLFESFVGSDAEFTRIYLPTPTQTCIENRLFNGARCDGTPEERVGSAEGACDDEPNLLKKVVSTGLQKTHFDPSIPEALLSPGYDVVKLFTLTGLQLADVFEYWKRLDDPREAVCQWIVDNQDWGDEFVPRTYPRTLQEGEELGSLLYTSYALAGMATILVIATAAKVYCERRKRIMVFAQVEFLFILLAGLLIISLGAIVISVPATNGTCVASIWLINLGYTFELIPLIVKVSAINRLFTAAASMRRVVLRRESLFGAVIFISSVVVVFLIIWTVLDPPRKQEEFDLTDDLSEDEDTIILTYSFCSSGRDIWTFLALGWNCVMLICATVLAVQSRKIQQDFNESQTLAIMIYSHSMFVILRVVVYMFPSGVVNEVTLTHCLSIIFSADTIVTIAIYFVPKFLTPANGGRKAGFSNRVWFTSSAVGNSNDKAKEFSTDPMDPPSSDMKSAHLSSDPLSSDAMSHNVKCSHCGHGMLGSDCQTASLRVKMEPITSEVEATDEVEGFVENKDRVSLENLSFNSWDDTVTVEA